MKWLVLMALLANLLFFIAHNNRTVTPVSAYGSNGSYAGQNAPSLLLLAERPEPIERQLAVNANYPPAHSAQSDWCELIGPF